MYIKCNKPEKGVKNLGDLKILNKKRNIKSNQLKITVYIQVTQIKNRHTLDHYLSSLRKK